MKKIEKGKYSEKDIKSWIWCLDKSLKSQSNVSNGKILYCCQRSKFSEELKVGNKFIFGYFLSTSVSIEFAKMFADEGTLFIIKIENNDEPNFYCKNIDDISIYQDEEEVLFNFNCIFEITKREKDRPYEKIYLTCLGYNAD